MRLRYVAVATLIAVLAALATVALTGRGAATTRPSSDSDDVVTAADRAAVLARAQVWRKPAVEPAAARLGADPGHPTAIDCRFVVTRLGGTARKFDCELDDGERIRVKYGRTPEIPAEVAAARLLHVLGFGADDVRLVEHLRCHGCPADPFLSMKAADLTRSRSVFRRFLDYSSTREFHWVSVERKHPGQPISTSDLEGWAFFELDQIDAEQGGAPRAHLDALRLLAVLLAHWDNKSENQRLVCLSGESGSALGGCRRPLAMLQDVGGTFGPRKVDLEAWAQTPIWTDRGRCTTDMSTLPYDGSTFAPVTIGEAGRRHLASLLGQLSDAQLADLFAAARFDRPTGLLPSAGGAIDEWVRVFRQKADAISAGPACPS